MREEPIPSHIALEMPKLFRGINMDKIVFYDGNCGLCQRSISFLSKIDSNKELIFAPLNGETYQMFFKGSSNLSTVVFYNKEKISVRSEAIIEVCRSLGGIKKMAVLLRIFPLKFRDKVYDLIADQRKKVSCIILRKDERFLK